MFLQAIDTRTPELEAQGVRPRVWFGERWITSIFDLFEENVRYFSPLLPEDRQVAGTPMMRGDTPAVHYLNLHNGTVWRWNRPIYAPGTPLAAPKGRKQAASGGPHYHGHDCRRRVLLRHGQPPHRRDPSGVVSADF